MFREDTKPRRSVENNLDMLSLQSKSNSLEEEFRELTMGEVSLKLVVKNKLQIPNNSHLIPHT